MAAVKALSLDPNLAEAHAAVAVLASMMEWDWERAEVSFLRAIRLDPSFTGAYSRYAMQLTAQGRFAEAVVQLERDTAGGDRLDLRLAIDYSARASIVNAAKHVVARIATGELPDMEPVGPPVLIHSLQSAQLGGVASVPGVEATVYETFVDN